MQNKNAHIATSIGHDSYFWLGGPLLGAWGHRNAIELDPWTLYTLGPVAMWKSMIGSYYGTVAFRDPCQLCKKIRGTIFHFGDLIGSSYCFWFPGSFFFFFELGTLCIRKFLKTYCRPLLHIMGTWPLGTHASCVKKSEGPFFTFWRFD